MRWVQLCGRLNILWHCLSLGLKWKVTFSSLVATAEKSWKQIMGIDLHFLSIMCFFPANQKNSGGCHIQTKLFIKFLFYIEDNLPTILILQKKGASLVAQMVKNPPAMQEIWVQSLGWEDPLEKGMATHSNILAWRIPWTGDLAGCSPWSHKEVGTTEQLTQKYSNKISNCVP